MSFIQKIHIDHVRHLHDLTIELDDKKKKHLILTGKNGSGKTSVLMAIQRFLSQVEQPVSLISSDGEAELFMQDIHSIASGFTSGRFILACFPAKRQSQLRMAEGPKKLDIQTSFQSLHTANDLFLQYLVNLKTECSFARDDADLETVKRIDHWFDQFQVRLRELFSDPSLELVFDRKDYNFYFQHEGHERFDFNTLSDGYAAIMNIVTELMMRMHRSETAIYDMPGIVMVDEIETHLHLAMQKQVLPFLTTMFPNIQFIVTSHSPFVLNSVADAVVYDLEYQEAISDLSGYSYEALVESYFEQDQYSGMLKEKIEEYAELIQSSGQALVESPRINKLQSELSRAVQAPLAEELRLRFYELEAERGITHGSH